MLGVELDDPIVAVCAVAKYLVEMGDLVMWVESVVRRWKAVKDIYISRKWTGGCERQFVFSTEDAACAITN